VVTVVFGGFTQIFLLKLLYIKEPLYVIAPTFIQYYSFLS